jgi:tRNA(Ile)-lysidine synthase
MGLLAALLETAPSAGCALAVGHVDHGWRGAQSRRDAEFVERFCRRKGLPFFLTELGPERRSGASREAAAREARYAALRETARRERADAIATAHTRDDVAETLLLALIRGRPLEGLSGIRERREDGIVRPLLSISREDLDRYRRARRVPARRDRTNDDLSMDRNWIRRRIVPPLVRRFGTAVVANLAASAEALTRDREWIEEEFRRNVLPLLDRQGRCDGIPAERARALPSGARRRLILTMAADAAGAREFAPTRREMRAIEDRLVAGSDFRFQAGRRVEFRARKGAFTASPTEPARCKMPRRH